MNRTSVYIKIYNDTAQETALLLHPHNATCEAFNDLGWVTPLIQLGLRVVTLDFRGYGRSPKITEKSDYSGDCFENDISFALGQSSGPIHVIGYSIGAAAGLLYAFKYRSRVKSMVLGGLGIGPLAQLGLYVGSDANKSREKALGEIGIALSSVPEKFRRQFEFAKCLIEQENLKQIVGSDLPASTLLVSGSSDRFCPNEIYTAFNSGNIKFRAEVIEGLGHGDCFVSPVFKDLALKFIAETLVK